MILTCPSCGTQYVVKDGAIPPEGRQVRCASCKHSWHQDPEPQEAAEGIGEEDNVPSGEAPDNGSQEQAVTPDTPSGGPAFDEREDDRLETEHFSGESELSQGGDEDGPPEGWFPPADDEFAPFGQREEAVEERGSGIVVKLLLLVLVVALLAVAFWFLAPADLKSRLGIAQSGKSELQLLLTYRERQKLASGNDLVVVTGRVINPTDEPQPVPPIHAEIRRSSGEVIYSWTIAPPAASIPPGGRAPFNSAEMNVPANGELLTVAFAKGA